MSDEASAFPGLPDDRAFSREVFQHALDRKGAVHKCEACGKDKWVISQCMMLLQALQPDGGVAAGPRRGGGAGVLQQLRPDPAARHDDPGGD